MSSYRSAREVPPDTLPERNPCDCNCVLFGRKDSPDRNQKFKFKLNESERLATEHQLFSPDRDSSEASMLRKKISVAQFTRKRDSKKSSRRKLEQSNGKEDSESKALMELLQRPAEQHHVSPARQQPQPHPVRLNQTYQLHRPVIVVNHLPHYHEESSRGFSKPSLIDKSAVSTTYQYRTTEGLASINRSNSRQELLNSFMGRPLQTNSFIYDPRYIVNPKSMAQSTDMQRVSEFSARQQQRMVFQQTSTKQVPDTVPEEMTSRSNTVDVVIPPIPLRDNLQSKDRMSTINEVNVVVKHPIQGSRHSGQPSQFSRRQSVVPPIPTKQSVNPAIFLREVESVLNYSPDTPPEQTRKPPMRFKKIESVGDDIEGERDDDCSEVLGHYSPNIQLPIRKLVRMSEAAERPTTNQTLLEMPTNAQIQCLSSRSRYDRSGANGNRPSAMTERVHLQHNP